MSLQHLISCPEDVFEQLVNSMDHKEVITTMNDIIAEMDREQAHFDSLSLQLSRMTDQASAEFKDISTQLIKCQNRLALLMERNMFCFNLQKQGKPQVKRDVIVTKDTRPSSVHSESQSKSNRSSSNTNTTPVKKKVVKVTRKVVTRKVGADTEGLDPQLKSIMESRRNMIKSYNNTSESSNGVSRIGSEPTSNTVVETAAVTLATSNSSTNKSSAKLASRNGHDEARTSSNHSITANPSPSLTETAPPISNIDAIISEQASTVCPITHNTIENDASSDTDTASSVGGLDYTFEFTADFESEKVKERVFMKNWNPIKVLEELYAIKLAKERSSIQSSNIVNMEGYLEQLPIGKKKTTLLKTWKRIFCKAKDGILYLYKSKNMETETSSYLSIMGGTVEDLSNKMIGIDDRRGHYLMVRCANDMDYRNWLRSLYTQIKCSPSINYIRPTLTSPTHQSKVVVVDLGSCSVRAGLLGTLPSYPQIFFPCSTALNSEGKQVFGTDAYYPENRANGVQYPVAASKNIDKYRINVEVMYDLFTEIFQRLEVTPSEHKVMLSTPHNFSSRLKEELLRVFFNRLKVKAVNIVNQSLLTPYSYNATSGIVVDIGERIDIAAITHGYLVEGGASRRSFGGTRITDNLNSSLMEYRLFTPVEHLVTRLIKEKTCFISQDYDDDLLECMGDNSLCQATVDLEQFDFPEGAHLKLITVDAARFKAPEGLIKNELLGVDSPTLPQLVQQAVAKCPMDLRREMWQSIYLSGGTTLIEGFPERLEAELKQIAPPSITVQVHASVHRYHAAYIGACILASLPNFEQSCVTREEWTNQGKASLKKWKNYFQG